MYDRGERPNMMRSKLYWKVLANFIILLVMLTALTVITLSVLKQVNRHFDFASDDLAVLNSIEDLRASLSRLSDAADSYTDSDYGFELHAYGSYFRSFQDKLRNLRGRIGIAGAVVYFDRIDRYFEDPDMLLSDSGYVTEIHDALSGLLSLYTGAHKKNIDNAVSLNYKLGLYIQLINILFALFALALGFMFARSIMQPIRILKSGTKKLSEGSFTPVLLDRTDEFGQLANDFNNMSAMIGATYTKLNAYSELVTALNSSAAVKNVASRSLALLCQHTGAAIGAIYTLRGNFHKLEFIAGYAFDKGPSVQTEFTIGEGIPGRCAQDKKMLDITLASGSSDFVIRTGLADIPARQIVAAPILFKDSLLGVIVLGTADSFNDIHKDIIRDSVGQIGVALTNAKNFEAAQRLSLEVAEKNKELYDKNNELEKAYKVKSDFLAGMSHELRTPLNSIIGFSSVLLSPDAEPLSADQQQALEKILRNGKHLLHLINDILDISKLESGRMSVHVETELPAHIVKQSILAVEPLFAGKPVSLEQEDTGALRQLETDILKVKQILVNLLSNALKFTERGSVTVETAQENGMTRFIVRDTGIGISAEHLGMIFEEFTQIDSSASRKYKGTGLGLPIARRLARMLGGDILVKSRSGEGSEFALEIPTVLPQHIRQTSSGAKPRPDNLDKLRKIEAVAGLEKGTRILCIDDDPDAIDILKKYLVPEGFSVCGAASGEEGIKLAIEQQPALITLDIMLPDKDGWQVLRELKQHEKTRHIPVIIHSIVDNQPLAVSLGAIDIMPKPVDLNKLLAMVQLSCRTQDHYVLIVDDNKEFASVMKELIEQDGYSVKTAHNGMAALEIMQSSRPAIIFLDLVMPGMDGFEVVKRLKQNESLRNIPVVILSGKELSKTERSYLQIHTRDTMNKEDFSHEEILKSIKKLLTSAA